ncbi:MAG: hypothetical protein AAF688_08350, partial [Bacteroidota bacterium]
VVLIALTSCKEGKSNKKEIDNKSKNQLEIASVKEENFDLRNDSIIFNSATIENFDKNGNSINIYWIGQEKDTILRFYRKYDNQMKLIGAEYYEQGETEPSRDSVYINSNGLKVEASLNSENQISWQFTETTDENGNPVLKTYENGKGEYRGLDSLFFDKQNRVVKGFYEYSNGRRSSIKTYKYVKSDKAGNWTERMMYVNDTLRQKQFRKITYHNL